MRENRAFTGLRGFAALAVFTSHFWGQVAIPAGPGIPALAHLGVAVFFVLSGYLLYSPFVRGSVETRPYLWRRALRILPLYWVVLTLIAVCGSSFEPGVFSQDWWRFYGLVWVYGGTQTGMVQSWSLCAEIVFYLALPVLAFVSARLAVEQQLLPTRGGVTFGPPKSSRSRRTIALDPETVDALHKHRETQLLERAVAGPANVDGDLVFCDELGGPIHPQRLTQWFREQRKAAGIPVGTLHTLRHTAATLALTAGVPVHIVAARLGDDAKTVLSTYAHLLPQSDEIAAERVAAALTASAR